MTTIEWTDETWGVAVGCSRVSSGCENCYAERFAHRGLTASHRGLTVVGSKGPRWTGEVRFVPEMLSKPFSWRKPRRVFVNSMSDLFHDELTNEQIAAVFGVMAACPQHTFQILTKRPKRMREWFDWIASCAPMYSERGEAEECFRRARQQFPDAATRTEPNVLWEPATVPWPLPNVWLGVSVEDQKTADERIPLLLATPAAIAFVSYEPALGPVNFGAWLSLHPDACSCDRCFGAAPGPLDWIIVGGESGPRSRPFDLAWARTVIEQCREARVPVFCKQLGAAPVNSACIDGVDRPPGVPVRLRDRKGKDMAEWPAALRVRQFPGEALDEHVIEGPPTITRRASLTVNPDGFEVTGE